MHCAHNSTESVKNVYKSLIEGEGSITRCACEPAQARPIEDATHAEYPFLME